MMTRRFATVIAAVVALVACAHAPAPDQLLSTSELGDLVTDRTLYVPACCNTPDGTLLYLAKDGTGWLDSRLMRASHPRPSGMSIVFHWHVADGSQVCLWAAPRIGDMPSIAPASFECLQVLRSQEPPNGLKATIKQDCQHHTGPLYLYPFNAFTQPVIDQYLTQVRVLYGGHIPAWTAANAGELCDGVIAKVAQ